MTKRIEIVAQPREQITVNLVGEEYLVDPPKGTYGIKLAQRAKEAGDDTDASWALIEGWVQKAFGKKQSKKVLERLMDDDDDLDVPHIMQLIEALAETVTGDPTTSSSDSAD